MLQPQPLHGRRRAVSCRLAVVLLTLAIAPLAQADAHAQAQFATIEVSPAVFSPSSGAMQIDAALRSVAPIGLQVLSRQGTVLGWLTPEARRRTLHLAWRGVLSGRRLPDGAYRLRLVSRGKRLAEAGFGVDTTAPTLDGLRVENDGAPFLGDVPLLATVTPNGDGLRDRALIRFRLSEPATLLFEANRTTRSLETVFNQWLELPAGPGTIEWTPPADLGPRTYLLRFTLVDDAGNRRVVGQATARLQGTSGPVVRVQGVDAVFAHTSYAAGDTAVLHVSTDASAFQVQLFRSGPELVDTPADNALQGIAVGVAATHDWRGSRNAPGDVTLRLGDLPSGVYFAQLTATDGRVGYAPFIVRPTRLGAHRVAVVMPTNTWQAYNFYDASGDGWGDTWYAGGPVPVVQLDRPFLRRGVPPFFRRYDLPFLRWLAANGHDVDVLSDDELETASASALSAAYDLIVFPGHHEYVTDAELAATAGYRDRGGNLLFLSANNFFWRVEREGTSMRRTRQWRDLAKPEAALIGVQYRGNDDGSRQAPFIVRNTTSAPWLWEGTGLTVGSKLGADIGGYGTEIDGTAPSSPPGIVVLAEVPDLFGPGKTAQMTYYETAAGAKVFAAGTLDFGGSVNHEPQSRLVQNLWAQLSRP